MSLASLVGRVETAAEQRYGGGTAVSVDRVPCASRRYGTSWSVRIWNKRGRVLLETPPLAKTDALRYMLAALKCTDPAVVEAAALAAEALGV